MRFKQSIFVCCVVITFFASGMDEKRKSGVAFNITTIGDKRELRSSKNLEKYKPFHEKACKKNPSLYMQFRKENNLELDDLFDRNIPEPNSFDMFSKNCGEFNLTVILLIEKEYNCLKDLLDAYETSDSFLKCRSEKNKKGILHHLFEHIDDDNIQYISDFVNKILAWHPTILGHVDSQGKIPYWYLADKCSRLKNGKEIEATLQKIIKNYGQLFVVPKSISCYFVNKNDCESLKNELKNYDPQQHGYLLDCVDPNEKKTLVHFVLGRMTKETFDDNFCILKTLIKYHPEFIHKFDAKNSIPLDYVHKILVDVLTKEQKEQLVQLLSDKRSTNLLCACFPFFIT